MVTLPPIWVFNEKTASFLYPEFKLEAASLVLDQGYSVSEACKSLDVGESVLRLWVDQLRDERGGKTPASKAMTEEQKRIQELETEKQILKKATAILMSDEFKHRR